jgi:putative glycosyl hydrolase-like family 15 (GHL15) protein
MKLIILIVMMILIVGGAWYLWRYTDIELFRPKASSEIPKSETSAGETVFNPYGDAWALKGPSNPSIPVGLTPGCYFEVPKSQETTVTAAEMDYLARSNHPLVWEACAVLQDDVPKLARIGAALKERNPALKYMGYYVAATIGEAYHFPGRRQVGFAELDQHHEECFVHKKGLPATRENRVRHAGGEHMLDVTDAACRSLVAAQITDALTRHHMGGVLIDGITPRATSYTPVEGELPDHVISGWEEGLVVFMTEIKRQMGGDKIMIISPYKVTPSEAAYNKPIVDRILTEGGADGVILEDSLGTPEHRGDISHIKNVTAQVAGQWGKYVLSALNVNFDSSVPTNEARERARARYFLAGHLNFFLGEKTPMIYYTRTQQWESTSSRLPAWLSEAFFRDWDLDIGVPLGPSIETRPNVWYRAFTTGYAFWNNSDTTLNIDFSEGNWFYTPEGVRLTKYDLPARSGMVFVKHPPEVAATLIPTPVPTAIVTTTITPTPTLPPSYRPGDVDGDGDVDIFDYNSIVSNFGRTGIFQGDLDSDGDVDIFDYNVVVSNFGRTQ